MSRLLRAIVAFLGAATQPDVVRNLVPVLKWVAHRSLARRAMPPNTGSPPAFR